MSERRPDDPTDEDAFAPTESIAATVLNEALAEAQEAIEVSIGSGAVLVTGSVVTALGLASYFVTSGASHEDSLPPLALAGSGTARTRRCPARPRWSGSSEPPE